MRMEYDLVFKFKTDKRLIRFASKDGVYESMETDLPDVRSFMAAFWQNIRWIGRYGSVWISCPDHPNADKYGSVGYWTFHDQELEMGKLMQLLHKLHDLIGKEIEND